MEEIISAISTASGVGGVAIIRLSGDGVLNLTQKMFKPLNKKESLLWDQFQVYLKFYY